ncbi:MAG: iron ABC transporter permease [Deltaproteobacteria bacterium]|nr:iron ABC transporter permease [Deltaproteobacteria bacterium]
MRPLRRSWIQRTVTPWLLLGWSGVLLVPWYALDKPGFFGFVWPAHLLEAPFAPVAFQTLLHGRWWLLPPVLFLMAPLLGLAAPSRERVMAWLLIVSGAGGGLYVLAQGFALGLQGWNAEWLAALAGAPGPAQKALGMGGLIVLLTCLILVCLGVARLGACRKDSFITSSIGMVVALIGVFIVFPVGIALLNAVRDNAGHFVPWLFVEKLFDGSIWGVGCLYAKVSCGVAWNTLVLALVVGALSTLLGLTYALIAVRTAFRFRPLLRVLTVLPIITPPFVIGMAVILLFGRSGAFSNLMFEWFGMPRSRWIYGFSGVAFSQVLAFAPIAFLVLIGVVQGISPALEEASQTLRANRWVTFWKITFPLMRPGIANAFLLGFIESMADFGNPMVLGGNFEVLSTRIFYAVVGASHDQGRAAVLALVLLLFTVGAFYAQQRWLGRRAYTTMTGKGDSGVSISLPDPLRWFCFSLALPWALLTLVIYVTILGGGFVRAFGFDYGLTLKHYLTAFSVEWGEFGLHFTGSAWDSFRTTVLISALSAPLTAALGLLTAYLLTRQRFVGRSTFEFASLMSFAIPGTVIGVSYIYAFNTPPFELTGTGLILVICFVFRNMPVGVRAGIAALAQVDPSLDEASFTLGARSFTTVRRVILPLLRPALTAALVYSFVRAMTAISAVIFLVSAQYNMATAYIIGRVEIGEFGLALAYSSVLIVVMLLAILGIQTGVGERKLSRREGPGLGIEGVGS